MKSLVGNSTRPMPGSREPIYVHPDVRTRLNALLMRPEMRGTGYSEFLMRACEAAEDELHERRHAEQTMADDGWPCRCGSRMAKVACVCGGDDGWYPEGE